ncbi:MAG: CRISPR/Cas system-associated endoribonuclease Cas2 [Flammeovirgaceae bacterium]|jgi:CRISPR/Cas system-associated endoribonuclease Cas2
MTKVNYTLLAEGIPEELVIPEILKQINQELNLNCQFKRSSLNVKYSSKPSKSKVLSNLEKFVQDSKANKEALFIVGVDLDTSDFGGELREKQIRTLKKGVKQSVGNSEGCIFFVPVQAFDYWLAYQNYRISKEKKPANNSLEGKDKKAIKKIVYGDKQAKKNIENACRKIIANWDLQELQQQSKSFKHFYQQIDSFLQSV